MSQLPPLFIQLNRLSGIAVVVLFLSVSCRAQTVLYNQPFSGTLAASGWTSTDLTSPWGNGSAFGISNIWQLSDLESGLSSNNCGTSSASDPSLYMGATGFATGAAYLSDANTNRRISSPNINTTGYSSVILDFDFIGNGEGTTDKAYLVYSINGGTSWLSPTGAPTSANPAMGTGGSINNLKSQICGGGQGRWTHITWNMPVTCENITNLRVGVVWQSNNNSVGSDPSFAIDDVRITATIVPAPIELLSFTAKYNDLNEVGLRWVTASETNNDYFTIERSVNGIDFSGIINLPGAGNSSQILSYSTTDNDPVPGISYYRLKQTDFNGDYEYSKIVSVAVEKPGFDIMYVYYSPELSLLEIGINCPANFNLHLELFCIDGKKVFSADQRLSIGNKKLSIPSGVLNEGIYVIKLTNGNQQIIKKIKC